MHQINGRGTFLLSKVCIPYLLKSENPHILNSSTPLWMEPKYFSGKLAYSLAKAIAGMCVLGMAEEFKGKIAVNSLWPRTSIATAAIRNKFGGDKSIRQSRTTDIMADAAYIILTSCAKSTTGNFFIDDEVIGPHAFNKYNVDPNLPVEELE